ncbi:dihydrolipoamide acetyltransferase family protein [Plantactinospora sp. KBS50]|uniref:dihydrolipoamide acetyltransferase family protein n=1 Tax=Plantactinospora sp. KBS50 TaxID=2024580 RepID=UPI000BAA98F9|nr:dihydrolipoamide acetyltransferase family protein [Plantactinospora sp. KBS50]ASW54940.1 branched-chain alpha-keto acid dehydrogenase subunit E2 [Plantactinospora sp. KBS50]
MTDVVAPAVQVFNLPDLGEGLTEAEIVAWRVAVGDIVEVDQPVVEVETAKAVVDVPCPYAGRVVALHGSPGQARPVGQPLITVAPLAEAGPAAPAGGPAPAAGPGADTDPEAGRDTDPAHATYREEERAGSGNVLIGYGTGHGPAGRRRRRPRPGPAGNRPAAPPARTAEPAAPLVISPLVRRLAVERGVDLHEVRGTGPGGVIRRADLDALPARVAAAGAPALAAVADPGPGWPAPAGPDSASGDVVIPLRGVRKAIADKLSRSRREIPEVTIWVDVDATALLETRAAINAARPEQPVSILALLARICVAGLRRFPQLNARVDAERGEIVQSGRIHLGIAAQTDRGLMVPVIADAQRLDTSQLSAALAETTAGARAGTLPPARLTGGTFTLNNYGVFGVDGSTPIINHPEAALLGIGRIVDKPWVHDGALAVRKVAEVSLTFDHRVCDGGVAGGFLRYVADCIESPPVLIATL